MAVAKLVASAQINIAAAGTEQRVVATAADRVIALYLSAPAANTGAIYLGDATVTAAIGQLIEKGTTREIVAPEGHYLDIHNMWVDAGTNNDKVNVSYLQLTT